MLFISRQVGVDKWGICDTDDMHEDILTRNEIEQIILDYDLRIEGTLMLTHPIEQYRYLSAVNVVQPANTKTAEQAKAKVMKHVDTQVYNGAVQGISVGVDDTAVRLSDYGTNWGSYVFWFNKIGRRTRFIFDDSLKFGSKTFTDWHNRAVIMDMTEVNNMKLVDYVYSDFISDSQMDVDDIQYYYIDRPERRWYPEALWIIHNGTFFTSNAPAIAMIMSDMGAVEDMIYKKYKRDMLKTCQSQFVLRAEKHVKTLLYMSVELMHPVWATTCEYAVLRDACMPILFDKLAQDTTISYASLRRLQNYITFFHVSPEIRKAFVDFCHRAVSWYLTQAK